MAGAAAGMILGCTGATAAAFVCPSHFLSTPKVPISQHSSSHVVFSCRDGAKSELVPSCFSFAVRSSNYRTLPVRNCGASLLPSGFFSSSSSSSYRSLFVHSGHWRISGLVVSFNGGFFEGLKRDVMREKSPNTAGVNARSMAGQSEGALEEMIKIKNSQNAVVVYSKSWCPYCGMVKGLFKKVGAPFELVELDQHVDEQELQDALRRLTGQSTVPNVFIGGNHIGGCDDTMALHQSGELIPALEAAGLKITGA